MPRLLALLILFIPTFVYAQNLSRSFAPPSGDGGFSANSVLGAAPAPKAAEPTLAESLIFDAAAPAPPPKIWAGGFEFGMNGAEGNSNLFNVRLGADARRETATNLYQANLMYTLSMQDGIRNTNRALFNSLDEFKWTDSNWSPFIANAIEYDEFRAYDFRIAGHVGGSYRIIQNDFTKLRSRLGVGGSVEFTTVNDTPNNWVPEGLFGIDFEHQFSDRQRFVATGDYYPDLGYWERFRVRFRAAYEILVDPETNLTLRLGVQDRFDSQAGPNTKQNDVDYFATLLLRF